MTHDDELAELDCAQSNGHGRDGRPLVALGVGQARPSALG